MENPWVQTTVSALRVLAFVYDVITFPVYLVLQKPWKRRQLSKRVRVSGFLMRANSILFLANWFKVKFYSS